MNRLELAMTRQAAEPLTMPSAREGIACTPLLVAGAAVAGFNLGFGVVHTAIGYLPPADDRQLDSVTGLDQMSGDEIIAAYCHA